MAVTATAFAHGRPYQRVPLRERVRGLRATPARQRVLPQSTRTPRPRWRIPRIGDSRSDLARRYVHRGKAPDPCARVARNLLGLLYPRWGGGCPDATGDRDLR